MAVASASRTLPFHLKFQSRSLCPTIGSSLVGGSHHRPFFTSTTKLTRSSSKLSSSYSISSYGLQPILLQSRNYGACSPTPRQFGSYSQSPLTIVAAKGYKIKTHKASAKRFRVSGRGKIMRRKAGKQHLLAKKSTKRKLRLSKMVQVNRSDYDNVIGCLPYLKVNRNAK